MLIRHKAEKPWPNEAQRRLSIVRQNVVFSIVVLAVLIPVALSGVISITMTVVAHEAAELLAVANGLRALKGGRHHNPIAEAT